MKNRTVAILITVAFIACHCSLLFAEEWYVAYQAGIDAVNQKNWGVAESKLKTALATGPKSGKKVKFYGLKFDQYVPHYYLGVVYANTNRNQEAQNEFQQVDPTTLFPPQLANLSGFQEKLASSQSPKPVEPTPAPVNRNQGNSNQSNTEPTPAKPEPTPPKPEPAPLKPDVAPVIAKVKNAVSQNKPDEARAALDELKKADPSNPEIPALAESIGKKELELKTIAQNDKKKAEDEAKAKTFDSLIQQANQSLSARNYDKARQLAKQANDTGINNTRVISLMKSIDIAEGLDRMNAAADKAQWQEAKKYYSQVASLDPQNPLLLQRKNEIDNALGRGGLIVAGLRDFYSGKYRESITEFEQILNSGQPAPATLYFYLGCSYAGLGYLTQTDSSKYLDKSKQLFAKAKLTDSRLAIDTANISPKIIALYQESR